MKTIKLLTPLLLTVAMLLAPITSGAQPVTKIAAGFERSFFLKSDGSLWGMGVNASGDLGDGTYNNTNRPEQIISNNVIAVAAGDEHSLFLKFDGSLWGMGDGGSGQLGDGRNDGTNQPEQIVSSNVIAIAAGSYHSLFLKSDGSLWAMGDNGAGQLGDGTYTETNQPEQIVSSNVVAIAAGDAHSLFLKSDGSLWAMGSNQYGELGDGIYRTAYPFGTNRPEQIVASNVVAIALGCDSDQSLFLKSDGSLWAMGWNYYGQLGDGTLNNTNLPEQIVASNVVAIAAGFGQSLFLESDGSLWAMGWNYYGQLGDGTTSSTSSPEKIVSSGVVAVACGGYHSLFTKSDGSLWAMGENGAGELGDGFAETSYPYGTLTPEQIFPSPQPVLISARSSQTNLQFNATCGFGGNFFLLGSSDMTLPLNQWTPLATNSITARGTNNYSVTLTNAFNPGGRQFYILQSK